MYDVLSSTVTLSSDDGETQFVWNGSKTVNVYVNGTEVDVMSFSYEPSLQEVREAARDWLTPPPPPPTRYKVTLVVTPQTWDDHPSNWDWQELLDMFDPVEVLDVEEV